VTVRDLSWLVAAAGCVVAVVGVGRLRSMRRGLAMALDFWLAAGLLRLSAGNEWGAIAASAAIVVLRKMVMAFYGAGMRGVAASNST
jgi:hypothetical protein